VRFSWRGSLGEVYRTVAGPAPLTLITLGICYPMLQASLRKALVGRSRFGNARFEYLEDGTGLIGPRFLAAILLYPTLGLYWFWYLAREQRYILSGTRFAGSAGLWTEIAGGDLCKLHLGNLLILVVTLGLGWPVAAVRSWRTILSRMSLVGRVDLDQIVQEGQASSATGDVLEGALDADLTGLDIGL
jgi:uncharacterized membrane protein YjgN (DUF898 family)